MAYANLYGIPAGIFGVIFLVLCGIFLVGLSYGKKDWSLLVLVLAAAGLTVYEITVSCGYAFLSDGVRTVLTWHGIRLMIPLAILAYLLLKRKRAFWRHLGIISLWSAAGLLVLYLISLLRGSYLSRYLNDSIVACSSMVYMTDWRIG